MVTGGIHRTPGGGDRAKYQPDVVRPDYPIRTFHRTLRRCVDAPTRFPELGPQTGLAGTDGPFPGQPLAGIVPDMKKRVFASLLWFYAGWFAGSSAAAFFELGPAVGPILGTLAAVAVALAPSRLLFRA
jgi:hypothetical protein